MSYRTNRMQHGAATIALVAGLVLLPLGVGFAGSPESGHALQLAQAPSAPGGKTAPSPRAGAAPPSRQPGAQQQGSQAEQLEQLKKQLQITPQQEPQFDAFAQVMRTNAQAMDSANKEQAQNAPKTAVDNLKVIEHLAETQLDGLKKLVPVFQTLYDSLSDQQKKTADQIFGRQQGGGATPTRPRG